MNKTRRSFLKASACLVGGGFFPLSIADFALAGQADEVSLKSEKSVPKWEFLGKRGRLHYRIRTRKGEYLVNRTGLRMLESMKNEKTSMLKCIYGLSEKHPNIPIESILLDCERFEKAAKAAAVI